MGYENAQSLKQQLAEYGTAIGFDLLRVCAPDAAKDQIPAHLKWLGRGYGGDMGYLARNPEARYDACSLLPACRSVIVTALNYFVPDANWPAPGVAKVSRYAWGDDYHEVLRDKLRLLAAWLDQRVCGHQWKVTVDTSPLTEKAFAVASGIGWAGRNSLVLNRELGSYFFIGMLLSSAELPQDEPLTLDCGTCSACLQACPTGALSGPGILDATKCISYLTTERNAAVTPNERLHGWLYGCDTCQTVCPYNADLLSATEPRFQPRDGIRSICAQAAAALTEPEFATRFAGTVIKRRRLDRFATQARNVLDESAC